VEIQGLDHVGWPLPLVSVAFDLVQHIKSLMALVKIAQQEKQQHSADQEKCYANTIHSLDTVIGYQRHVRNKRPYVAIKGVLIISQVKRRRYGLKVGGALSSGQLEDGPAGGGKGGASCGRVVPALPTGWRVAAGKQTALRKEGGRSGV